MNSQTQIGLLESSLRQIFAENGLGRFNGGVRNEGRFICLSGTDVTIFFRAALSTDFVAGRSPQTTRCPARLDGRSSSIRASRWTTYDLCKCAD
jgi:hypothetical protein